MQTQLSLQNNPTLHNNHNTTKYNTTLNYCNCPFSIHHPDQICRHRLELQNQDLKFHNENKTIIIQTMSDHIGEIRDIRDKDNTGKEGAVETIHRHNPVIFGNLMEITYRWALEHGTVTSDDLHTATNEAYSDNKIIGAVFHVMLKANLLKVTGSVPTKRKIAHGRRINIYELTDNAKTVQYRSSCTYGPYVHSSRVVE